MGHFGRQRHRVMSKHYRSLSGSGGALSEGDGEAGGGADEAAPPTLATVADFVAHHGGKRPIEKVLIANNGIAVRGGGEWGVGGEGSGSGEGSGMQGAVMDMDTRETGRDWADALTHSGTATD